ncbi:MAG: hypothetical protein IK109_03410 [Clostridiales bacterium]|nr:hypothetical protein [Clostridiales bacterium]
MKRAISLLLTSAMILSLAGCSKSKETKKTKKPKKTTSTKITETEDPETETEVPSDTDETESNSTQGPKIPVDLSLHHDLEVLEFNHNIVRNDYAEMTDKFPYELFWVCSHCDQYQIATPGYDALSAFLDDLTEEMTDDSDEHYSSYLSQFDGYIATATEDDVWLYTDHYRHNQLSILRADEKVLSFYRTITTRDGGYFSDHEHYTLDSKTGKLLELGDIITDFNAFADAVEAYESNHFYAYTPSGLFSTMADHLRKGELDQLEFCVNQNCILIFMDYEDSVGDISEYVCYVSALAHTDCIDPEYFIHTPENYTLTPDSANEIYWDFDEDGNIDKFVIDYDENYTTGYVTDYNIEISINGEAYAVGDYHEDSEGCYELGDIFLMSVNGEYRLYIEGYVDDPTNPYFLFNMNGKSFDYIDYLDQISWYPYDPNNIGIQIRGEILGTGSFTKPSTLCTGNGLPLTIDSFYHKTGVGLTTKKMQLGLFTEDGQPTGESITVPAGTPVRLEGIDTDKGLAYFTTLHRDASQNESFQMVLTVDPDYEYYDVRFDGEGNFQLFKGSHYYD